MSFFSFPLLLVLRQEKNKKRLMIISFNGGTNTKQERKGEMRRINEMMFSHPFVLFIDPSVNGSEKLPIKPKHVLYFSIGGELGK